MNLLTLTSAGQALKANSFKLDKKWLLWTLRPYFKEVIVGMCLLPRAMKNTPSENVQWPNNDGCVSIVLAANEGKNSSIFQKWHFLS